MTAPIVFIDTETTGLTLNDDIWEFAGIRREPDGSELYLQMFIEHSAIKCADLPDPFRSDHDNRFDLSTALTPRNAAHRIHNFLAPGHTGKCHWIGAVPDFDATRVANLLTRFSFVPTWHYHLCDVENLAVGVLAGRAAHYSNTKEEFLAKLDTLKPPWDSEKLSIALNIDPARFARHTAMGDVHWAKAIWDYIMEGK